MSRNWTSYVVFRAIAGPKTIIWNPAYPEFETIPDFVYLGRARTAKKAREIAKRKGGTIIDRWHSTPSQNIVSTFWERSDVDNA